MSKGLKSFRCQECINLQMELLEILLEVPFLESLLFADQFQDMFKDGQDQYVLEDMPLVISIEQLTLLLMDLENLK